MFDSIHTTTALEMKIKMITAIFYIAVAVLLVKLAKNLYSEFGELRPYAQYSEDGSRVTTSFQWMHPSTANHINEVSDNLDVTLPMTKFKRVSLKEVVIRTFTSKDRPVNHL